MKKVLVIILSLIMILSLNISAFASSVPESEKSDEVQETESEAVQSPASDGYERVFIIGIDGAGRFYKTAETPNFDRIFESGAVDYTARTETIPVSAQNWGSMLMGVSYLKHGLTNTKAKNNPKTSNSKYPSVFKLVHDVYPDAELASFVHWNNINIGMIEDDIGVNKVNVPSDEELTDKICEYFDEGNDPKLFFCQFDSVDDVGHGEGSKSEAFINQITTVDGFLGRIYDCIEKNGLLENSLFMVVSDHGHLVMGGHWGLTMRESNTTLAVRGKTVVPGAQMGKDTRDRDVASIVLYALGISQPGYMTSKIPDNLFEGEENQKRNFKADKADTVLSAVAWCLSLCTAFVLQDEYLDTFVNFILLFVFAEAVICLIRFLFRKKKFKKVTRIIFIALEIIIGIVMGVLVLAGPVQLRQGQPLMMALYVAMFADGVADILYSIILALFKKQRKYIPLRVISLVFGVAFFLFGFFNMQNVKVNRVQFTSPKLTEEHTFAFLADLHVGSAQKFSTTEDTIEKIKSENPEFLLLGGDITDDYTTKEEMKKTFALFKDIGFPVYYIYGNHDRQGHAEYAYGRQYTTEEYEKAMLDNGVIILKDQFAQPSTDLLVLGREDLTENSRKDIYTLRNPDPNAYLITVDHQPVKFKDNIIVGTDLMLSGHTHAGQLFPLKFFYSLIGYVEGEYTEGDSTLYVTSGACGWRVPLRTDDVSRVEIITVSPEK